MGDREDERLEEVQREKCTVHFSLLHRFENAMPAVNMDNLQAFKPEFLPNFSVFANQNLRHHLLRQPQAASK